MNFMTILLINPLFVFSEQNIDSGFCEIGDKSCRKNSHFEDQKLLFYDANPSEGFNLRRDVYMRFAILLAEAQKAGDMQNWSLVLPPWYQLYHWRSAHSRGKPHPWGLYFDVESLKSYAPVLELHEVFSKTHIRTGKPLEIDVLYVLQNYADPFEGGNFVEKWEESLDKCAYDGQYWGYRNITAKETICLKFQGRISMLKEIISLSNASKIMFAHGEIPLHDSYGTKSYWDCRKSMKFNSELLRVAQDYIQKHFECFSDKCTTYISVHWRRRDFSHSRSEDVPSIKETAGQIHEVLKTVMIKKIFIATDAAKHEKDELEKILNMFHEVYFFTPTKDQLNKFTDGGVGIIDQIICSHAVYFIGTHESTFSFRIQEEREILHHPEHSTFNRLCPDEGECEKVSKWTIVED